ncbi:hypothetical protein EON66_05470, partial [archaeon]
MLQAASEWLGSSLLTQLSPTTRANAKHFLAQVAATAAEGALSTDAPATTNLARLLLDTRDGEPPSMRADKLLAKKSHGQDTHARKPNELGGEGGASGEPLSSPEQGGANTLSRAARLLARRHSAAAAGGHASRNEAGTRTNVQNGDAPLTAHLNAHLAGNESAQEGERPASPRWLTGTGSSIRWNQAVRSWALPTPRILHASYDA